MSFQSVRPFFRTIMDSLNFREWDDGFSFENIPSNILDNSYHIESGDITSGASNHQAHVFEYPIVLRVFKKGFRNVGEALDDADETIETILDELLKPDNRLGDDIKDVVPNSISRTPLGDTNDNKIIIEFNFTNKIYRCF